MHIFDPENGGPMLWQHLFWFFGHPEVYVIALPFFGIISEVLPVFSRKPIFGYKTMVFATIAIAALSASVWAHHMYVTGQVLLPFFAVMTMLIAVPTGVKFFNWIGTMWGGKVAMDTPMLWAMGFLVTFLFGGLTGVIIASPALDFHLSDSYFIVAHFHYTVFGTVVFAMFSGFYFWWPKLTGRMLDERLGKIHFWMLFIGFHTTFLIQHWLGHRGHGPPLRRLPARGGVPGREHRLQPRRLPARGVDDPVPLQRVEDVEEGAARRHRRPMGLRRLARVGDVLPAAAPQLHLASRGSAPSVLPSTCTTPRPLPAPRRCRIAERSVQVMGPADVDGTPGERSATNRARTETERCASRPSSSSTSSSSSARSRWSTGSGASGRSRSASRRLSLTGALFASSGFYFWMTGKKLPLRPEDNASGEIAEQEGNYGYFVASSWTPLWLAGSGAIMFLGLAIGWWLFIIGAFVGVVAVCLWVFESFSGEYSI